MRCTLVTAVWGPWHTDVLIRFALPSLVAAGNLPSLQRTLDTVYLIHTSRADARRIRAAPVFETLSRTVKVEIVTHADRAFGSPIETHTRIWHSAVDHAKRANGFLCAVAPDIMWADGSFATVARLIGSGKKALYASFLRVVSETFLEEVAERHAASAGGVSAIAPRPMIDLILRHMHPLQCAYLRDSRHFPIHAEHILWPVGNEGFLMRVLANMVLIFHAVEYPLNPQFTVARHSDEVAFVTDSDGFAGASLTPLMKDTDWYFEPRTADLDEIGAWWLNYEGPAHQTLASQQYRFHAGDPTERAWQAVARQSDFFVVQALIAREMTRIGRTLKGIGCKSAAELLATALYGGRLRRRWRWPGPVTVFAPNDAAIAALSRERYGRLLSRDGARELVDFIAAHVAPGVLGDAGDARPAATVGGHALSFAGDGDDLRVNGHAVLARHALPEGHVVCVIDGVLAS
ncbi:MAG: fasciclin domain-containing protein [Proteobacteria bacterium]|nr:fasciclin domain-containing protein [Pseudomonadota bacterium]